MEYIKKINVPMVLLCLVTIKLLFSNESYAVAAFAIAVAGLFAYLNYLKSKEVAPLDEQVKKDLDAMRNQISNIAVKTNLKPQPGPNQKFF